MNSTPQASERLSAKDLALIAIFAGITAALALMPPIYTPLSPAPITAQSLGPMLAGAILGRKRGFLSQLLFVVLVAVGLPLLAGGRGGLGVFASPTVGFIIGYFCVPWFIGHFTYKVGAPYSVWKGIVINIVCGLLLMDVFGILGFLTVGHMPIDKAFLGLVPFIPGDCIKAILAALIAKGVHTAVPGMLPRRVAATTTEPTPTDAWSSN